jgi:group I intron endonuclease
MSQITGIYKITSPTNKIYIGKSKNIINRWKLYKNLKCKGQSIIYASLKRHGSDNHIFEIIEECEEKFLDERELFWYNYYKNDGYIMLNAIVPNELNPKNDSSDAVLDMETDGMTLDEAIEYYQIKELRRKAQKVVVNKLNNFINETVEFINKNPILAIEWINICQKEKQRLLNTEEKKS